jgi:L-ascorbate metabolism protein UlaG (beta-lactamase superfamily)
MATPDKPRRRRRILRRIGQALAVLAVVIFFAGCLTTDRFRAFGGGPSDETYARMQRSPQFKGGKFVNVEETGTMKEGWGRATKEWLFGGQMREPSCPLPIVTDGGVRLKTPAASGLRITWLGHSTTIIELDGAVIVTDPEWSERASPSTIVGPKRFHPPPIPIAELPHVDAVLVSHEHFDHLDMATIRALAAQTKAVFHVPLGIGGHLAAWDVPKERIVEHDWWERATIAPGVEVVSTPSRHFNGRLVPFRTGSLWTSWSIIGPKHRVFFSGDTGMTEAFREIGKREGPFDAAMLEIGQYDASWGDIHLGPNGALDAFAMLGAKLFVPIHWGTFNLAIHDWSDPPEETLREAEKRRVPIVTPRQGEPIEPESAPPPNPWWRALPPIASACP